MTRYLKRIQAQTFREHGKVKESIEDDNGHSTSYFLKQLLYANSNMTTALVYIIL